MFFNVFLSGNVWGTQQTLCCVAVQRHIMMLWFKILIYKTSASYFIIVRKKHQYVTTVPAANPWFYTAQRVRSDFLKIGSLYHKVLYVLYSRELVGQEWNIVCTSDRWLDIWKRTKKRTLKVKSVTLKWESVTLYHTILWRTIAYRKEHNCIRTEQ